MCTPWSRNRIPAALECGTVSWYGIRTLNRCRVSFIRAWTKCLNALFLYRNTILARINGSDSVPKNRSIFRTLNWSRFSCPPLPFLGSQGSNLAEHVGLVLRWMVGQIATFGVRAVEPHHVSPLGGGEIARLCAETPPKRPVARPRQSRSQRAEAARRHLSPP